MGDNIEIDAKCVMGVVDPNGLTYGRAACTGEEQGIILASFL